MSSLSRAFTTRKAKMSLDMSDIHKSPLRSNSTRELRQPILRHKISAPIQLVHTTNMLSYNAPDLPRPSISNSSVSVKSDADSEANSTTESTPPTSPDVSPIDECPSPVPNHLSTYFMIPEKPHATPTKKVAEPPPPAIPKRSPSHTKKNSYEAIAMSRQRSISRMSKESDHTISSKASYTFSRSSSTSTRASSVSSNHSNPHILKSTAPLLSTPTPPTSLKQRAYKETHPFGKELAQVTELAEEYGGKTNSQMDEEDSQVIKSRGLVKVAAEDYLSEIQGLFATFFTESTTHARTAAPLWI